MSGRRRFVGAWQERRLGEVAKMASGGTPLTSVGAYYDGGIPWVSITDMTSSGGKVITKTERTLSRLGLNNSAARLFPAGTVLYAMYASIGECSIAGRALCTSQAILGIQPGSSLRPAFLYYWLTQIKSRVKTLGQQGTQANLNKDMVQDLPLPLPPLPEQRAIAAVFSDGDKLIGSLEALIAKKRAIKQAAMQQLLTGRTRLPGFTAEWAVLTLGDHLRFLRHGNYPRSRLSSNGTGHGGVKYIHYGDIHTSERVCLDPTVTALPTLAMDRAARLDRLSDGDLVFVDASEDLGGVGKSVEIVGVRGHQVVSGLHTIAVRFSKSALADGFKAYLQFCPRFRNHLRRLAAGTKVYATNRAHIATAELRVPPLPEQRAIAAVLADMDAEIAALERRIDKTRAVRQGMMHQLLSGSIRLPIPEAAAEDESIR
ncbi:restriction endonuclease subunit S [Candidatus Palauibacter sp.]|uniref:restriction endonuclease subunit S n=1 Tax=Candidatus Palauibacter sp. TaxID=3101350 RepID=UPI003B5A2CB4